MKFGTLKSVCVLNWHDLRGKERERMDREKIGRREGRTKLSL